MTRKCADTKQDQDYRNADRSMPTPERPSPRFCSDPSTDDHQAAEDVEDGALPFLGHADFWPEERPLLSCHPLSPPDQAYQGQSGSDALSAGR